MAQICKTANLMILKDEELSILRSLESMLITDKACPIGYLVNVQECVFLQKRLRLLEGITRGECAIKQGRVVSHAAAEAKMQKWLT